MEFSARPPIRFPSTIACSGCHLIVHHPRWIRRDALDYEALCLPCLESVERGFTAQHAIVQAIGVIRIHQAILDGRIVMDGGAE